MPIINYKDLGIISYADALAIQEDLFNQNIKKKLSERNDQNKGVHPENYLLFCEHKHVITLGKSGKKENLLLSDEYLKSKGIDFFRTNRGGDITYHGPGQIVGYPILDLEQFHLDIHHYIEALEQSIINYLETKNIKAGRLKGMTGVWLDADNRKARKICAIGVKASRYITMHGFAFNVNTNLDFFKTIVPCGISDKAVTSMQQELGEIQDFEKVKHDLQYHIAKVFGAGIDTNRNA